MSEELQTDFEGGDAGASKVYPAQCSSLRKNGHVVIKVSMRDGGVFDTVNCEKSVNLDLRTARFFKISGFFIYSKSPLT